MPHINNASVPNPNEEHSWRKMMSCWSHYEQLWLLCLLIWQTYWNIKTQNKLTIDRGGSRAAATYKMELFLIIVSGFQPLTIITKRSILDAAAVLDPPLQFHLDDDSRCDGNNCDKDFDRNVNMYDEFDD